MFKKKEKMVCTTSNDNRKYKITIFLKFGRQIDIKNHGYWQTKELIEKILTDWKKYIYFSDSNDSYFQKIRVSEIVLIEAREQHGVEHE